MFRALNFDLCLPVKAIEKWGFISVPHLPWHPFLIVTFEDQWHQHCFLTLSREGINTCFNYLGLSILEYEHLTARMRDKHCNRLCHHTGLRILVNHIRLHIFYAYNLLKSQLGFNLIHVELYTTWKNQNQEVHGVLHETHQVIAHGNAFLTVHVWRVM